MGTNTFSWGFPEEAGQVTETGYFPSLDIDQLVRESLRNNATSSAFPLQQASPTAQSAAGIGIQNLKRGFLDLRIPYNSTVVGIDFQTSSTTYVDVNQELTGQMASSGRPVMIIVRGTSTGDACTFSARIDSTEVTGVSAGIVNSARGNGIWFATPDAGTHTYAMQWKVASGSLTALMPRSFRPALTVVEL